MNLNRVLNVSVILMLSLIFLCVFLFDFYRDLVFLNDDNDFEYYNSVEITMPLRPENGAAICFYKRGA